MFRVASLSKQFTAAALALAANDGLVDLDAPIGRYLPNLQARTRQIPLRFFMTHTAGFAGFEESLQPHVKGLNGKPVTFGTGDYLAPDELFELSRQTAPLSDPGEKFTYSNMSYYWLGRVIERVTDESLRQYISRKLLVPAGMRRSFISDNADEVIPDRATAYTPLSGSLGSYQFEVSETNLDWVGANALVTSINEFLLWDEQFRTPTLGRTPEAFRAQLVSRQGDLDKDDPDSAGYAFGLYVKDRDSYGRSVYHRGSWAAYRSIYKRYLDRDFAYFIFCNRSDVDREQISQAIEDIYLKTRS
ncbi:serine hydrolase domain-containing protein [Allohahella marinimesophila]|uniref:Serine hydrolase domain-containing protein n=2 Tax=Allohahella marinimesophila TaxID=1054972 RepID=A0ABP7NTF5_9GAMM